MLTQYIEEAKLRFNDKFIVGTKKGLKVAMTTGAIHDFEVKKFKSFLASELTALHDKVRLQIAEEIEKEKNGKIPYQSLLFQDCPNCEQEVNRKWVDSKCKEIFDQALTLSASIARGK